MSARRIDQFLEVGHLDGFDEARSKWFQAPDEVSDNTVPAPDHYNSGMELSERQRKYLRGLGHALNPVLLIGQHGMTPAVVAEAKRALHDHELIKVKFRGAERDARDTGLTELATATESILVHRIGHTALYYKRRNDGPGIVIPDA
jgi:RNA-binding protein